MDKEAITKAAEAAQRDSTRKNEARALAKRCETEAAAELADLPDGMEKALAIHALQQKKVLAENTPRTAKPGKKAKPAA